MDGGAVSVDLGVSDVVVCGGGVRAVRGVVGVWSICIVIWVCSHQFVTKQRVGAGYVVAVLVEERVPRAEAAVSEAG